MQDYDRRTDDIAHLVDLYQAWTDTTAVYPPENEEKYLLYGLVGEVGELFSKLAKQARGDYELDRDAIKKELGDVCWFIVRIAGMYGFRMSELLAGNIAKLSKRKLENKLKGDGDDR